MSVLRSHGVTLFSFSTSDADGRMAGALGQKKWALMLGCHSDAALMVLPTDPSDMKFEVNFDADWCVESTAFKMHCIKRLKAAQHLQIPSSLSDAVLKSVWSVLVAVTSPGSRRRCLMPA